MTQEMAITTRVHQVGKDIPTLRTSIPLDEARKLQIGDGDTLIWTEATIQGKKGLFARKLE